MKFKTIKELHESIKSGAIDETKLRIILDNDTTSFYLNEDEEIVVEEANGYYDIGPLYKIVFPAAQIGWC